MRQRIHKFRTTGMSDLGVIVYWVPAVASGALGGAMVEMINWWGRISAWQEARHKALKKGKKSLPRLRIDRAADTLALASRIVLGALAGWIFHDQVTGTTAAIAVGAGAPAMLLQLGAARNISQALQASEGGGTREESKRKKPRKRSSSIKPTSTPAADTGSGEEVDE
jgi:hypothetical protein